MEFEIEDISFGVSNTLDVMGESTRLEVSVLDPQEDRRKLEDLLESRRDLLPELACRQLTFGRRSEVTLKLAEVPGSRTVVENYAEIPEKYDPRRIPIKNLGLIPREVSDGLVKSEQFKALKNEPRLFKLVPGELVHCILRLQLRDPQARGAFVVQIDHWLDQNKERYIGGLSYVVLTPHNPFRAERPKSYPPNEQNKKGAR